MRLPESLATGSLGYDEQAALLRVARASIDHVLRTGRPLDVEVEGFPPGLREPRASFVTLRSRDGALRGCIGELEPSRALVASVADRARAAAFGDPRFPPLGAEELDAIAIHVSVLLPLAPIDAPSEADLLAQLRPGIDGLLIDDGVRRATFLPAVWNALPDPRAFLHALRRKAGMPVAVWPATLRAWRYEVEEIGPAASEPDRITAR
jgi:AmmeMemoRadiSam system protein A